MISRRDRVIATLVVWAVMLATLALFLQQFRSPGVNVWGNWYGFQSITSTDPLLASQT
ncbi:MAG: hypothetical protein IH587_02650 [Anaerolineae bacterium]|nr:hypothetical protein [Anaerolineae bacterium]